jgi:prepilin-type N-terminal cleavage/methylation domain-containing protein
MRNARRPAPAPRGAAGFTLLEVLVALMIFVLGISAILPLFAVAGASHKRGIDQSHVSWIAPRIAAKIQENLYSSNPKDIKGATWEEYGQAYVYDATFSPVSMGTQGTGATGVAFLLQVEVRWKEVPELRVETFETIVLRKLLRR